MKIYAIRESWDYEIYELVEFFFSKERALERASELTKAKSYSYNDYGVEEVIVK